MEEKTFCSLDFKIKLVFNGEGDLVGSLENRLKNSETRHEINGFYSIEGNLIRLAFFTNFDFPNTSFGVLTAFSGVIKSSENGEYLALDGLKILESPAGMQNVPLKTLSHLFLTSSPNLIPQ